MRKFIGLISFTLLFLFTSSVLPVKPSAIDFTPFGVIDDSYTVNPAGAYNHVIPIHMPPGVNKLVPSIAIVYDSRSPMSELGYGWEVSGLSKITRSGNSFVQNNKSNGITFSSNDVFLLDGQLLSCVRNKNGQNDSEYRTESETFSTVVARGQATLGKSNSSPKFFFVKQANGLTYYYGDFDNRSSDSRLDVELPNGDVETLEWNVSRVEDVNGNYIKFNYHHPAGSSNTILVGSIQYTANDRAEIDAQSEITFNYETEETLKRKANMSFIAGVPITDNSVLNNISIKTNGNVFKYYHFRYDDTRRRIIEIIESADEEANIALQPTKITWNTSEGLAFKEPVRTFTTPQKQNTNIFSEIIDLNNDGKEDIATFEKGKDATGKDAMLLSITRTGGEKTSFVNFVVAEWLPFMEFNSAITDKFFFSDLNGDALPDLITEKSVWINQSDRSQYRFSEGTCKDCTNLTVTGPASLNAQHRRFSMDLNGDGTDEYITFNNANTAKHRISGLKGNELVLIKEFDGAFNEVRPITLDGIATRLAMLVNSPKGDKIKTIGITGTQFDEREITLPLAGTVPDGFPANQVSRLTFRDLNLDGISDIVYHVDGSHLKYWIGDGTPAFRKDPLFSAQTSFTFNNNMNHQLGMFTSSSNLQLLRTESNMLRLFDIVFNRVEGLRLIENTADAAKISFPDKELQGSRISKWAFKDINRDGLVDIESRDFEGGVHTVREYRNTPNFINKVSSVKDGFNNLVSVKYSSTLEPSVYSLSASRLPDGYHYFWGPYTVVNELKYSNGTARDSTNSVFFRYTNLLNDGRGRGLTGFNTHSKTESTTGVTTTTEYEQVFPLTGKIKRESRATRKGLVYFDQVNDWSHVQYNKGTKVTAALSKDLLKMSDFSATKTSYMPVLRKTTVVKRELDSVVTSHSVIVNSYNDFGVIDTTKTTFDDGTTHFIVKKHKNISGNNNPGVPYIIGLTTTESSFVIRGNERMSPRTTSNEYDTKGRLIKQTRQGGDARFEKVSSFEYDRTGNLTKRYIFKGTNDEISEQFIYDDHGRFLVEQVNPLQFTTKFTYDPEFGNLRTEEDPNGLTISHDYDIFGNLTKTSHPDGRVVTYKYDFLNSVADNFHGSNSNAIYKLTSRESGEKPIFHYYDQLGREVSTMYSLLDPPYEQAVAGSDANPLTKRVRKIERVVVKHNKFDKRGNLALEFAPQYYQLINDFVFTANTNNNLNLSPVACVKAEDQLKLVTHFTYDVLNRLTVVRLPDGKLTRIDYSANKKTETNTAGRTLVTWTNSKGQTVAVDDDQKNRITYDYDPWGDLVRVTKPDGAVTENGYDLLGRKTRFSNPNIGTTTTTYDRLDRIISETTGKISATIVYDKLGRITSKQTPEGLLTWEYDGPRNNGGLKGRPAVVRDVHGNTTTFRYDVKGNLNSEAITLNGVRHEMKYEYDSLSRLSARVYPEGYKVKYKYINNSPVQVSEVKSDGAENMLWSVTQVNARGLALNRRLGNGLSTSIAYNDATNLVVHMRTEPGFRAFTPSLQTCAGQTSPLIIREFENPPIFNPNGDPRITDPGRPGAFGQEIGGAVRQNLVAPAPPSAIQDLRFEYDNSYNLNLKTDLVNNMTESYGYDNLNRLMSVTKKGQPAAALTLEYKPNGNILSKSDQGLYDYDSVANNRVVFVTRKGVVKHEFQYDENGNLSADVTNGLAISYNSFNKATVISLVNEVDSLDYGAGNEEIRKRSFKDDMLTKSVIRPFKNYEIVTENEKVTRIHYVTVGSELIAIRHSTKTGNEPETSFNHYIHNDLLGSIQVITDQDGIVLTEYAYSAFGERKIVKGQSALSDRGYTMHKHLDEYGIINAGGRIYLPGIGRFASADPFVQDPNNLQNLNRYSYVLNNPMSNVDPSGFLFKKLFKAVANIVKSVAKAVYNVGRAVVEFVVDVHVAIYEEASRFVSKYGKQLLIIAAAAAITYFSGGTMAGFAGAMLNGALIGGGVSASVAAIKGGSFQDILNAGFSGAIAGAAAGAMVYAGGSLAKAIDPKASYGAKQILGGTNGYISSGGKSDGFYRGVLAAVIPQDLGLGSAQESKSHWNFALNFLGSSASAAAQGYIMGGKEGMTQQLAGNTINFVAGHGYSMIKSKSWLPSRYQNGVNIYDATGDVSSSVGGAVVLVDEGHLEHEIKHYSQQGVLGLWYLPAHGVSQGIGQDTMEKPPFLNDGLYLKK